MKILLDFLNSNFGVLVSGAPISGLIVQYITSRCQQRSWSFQQQYMAEKATFDKELDQKYKLLEDINTAVAAVLAHSRFAIVAYVKAVPEEQRMYLRSWSGWLIAVHRNNGGGTTNVSSYMNRAKLADQKRALTLDHFELS